MKCPNGLRILLALALLALPGFVGAAEYIDGKLWLEILLASGKEVTVSTKNKTNQSFAVSEFDSPISRSIDGDFSIKLVDPEKLAFWGFLNRSELVGRDAELGETDVFREYFAWADSHLVIRREKQYFEQTMFSSYENARIHAQQTGIPLNQIQSIPMLNSTVRITSGKQVYYFETPLMITAADEVSFNGTQLWFNGEFIVKSIGEQLLVNHYLPLEEYIGGVIQNEIGSNAPIEALKAQAVTARTHAISLLLYNRHKNEGYDLCNTTHCQVYKGKHLSNDNIVRAIRETENMIMVFGDRIADATYHSSCGGKTDSSTNIWKGQPLPFLMGVTCWEECDEMDLSAEKSARAWIDTKLSSSGASSWERATLYWEKSVSRATVEKNLGVTNLRRVEIVKRGNSGRIVNMRFVGNKSVVLDSEYRIRQAFGGLSSSFFYIKGSYSTLNGVVTYPTPAKMLIRGKGSGHGVGMCQVGALKRAREGMSFEIIIQNYYPGVNLWDQWMESSE